MSNDVKFSYGFFDNLEAQAQEQGYTLGCVGEEAEKIKNCVHTMRVLELVTDSESDSIFKKLNKYVVNGLSRKTEF